MQNPVPPFAAISVVQVQYVTATPEQITELETEFAELNPGWSARFGDEVFSRVSSVLKITPPSHVSAEQAAALHDCLSGQGLVGSMSMKALTEHLKGACFSLGIIHDGDAKR